MRFHSGLATVKVLFGKYFASRPVPVPPDWIVFGTVIWRAALTPTRLWLVLPQMLFAASASVPSGVSGAQAKPRQSLAPLLYEAVDTKSAIGFNTPPEILDK